MSNFYIKYESLEGFLTKHTCIQIQSYGKMSLGTYQKSNVPTPPNNAAITTALKIHAYYITVIRRILTLEYIHISTSVSPLLETGYLSTRIINVKKYAHVYKLCVALQMLPTCILLYICLPNVKSLVLQCAYCTCRIITGTLAVHYTVAIIVVEEGGANLLKFKHLN